VASRKGSPNKVGAEVKENIIAVFIRLGSTAAMADWAKDNLTEFYRLYARLIPTEVIGEFSVRHVTELSDLELSVIATGGSAGATSAPIGEQIPDGVH
jgi:hypothetical protein